MRAHEIAHLAVDDVHVALRAHRELGVVRHHEDGGAAAR